MIPCTSNYSQLRVCQSSCQVQQISSILEVCDDICEINGCTTVPSPKNKGITASATDQGIFTYPAVQSVCACVTYQSVIASTTIKNTRAYIVRCVGGDVARIQSIVPTVAINRVGTATTCYVATAPALASVSGYYFADCNPEVPDGQMQNDALAAQLWQVSTELTKPYLLS